MPRLTIKTDVNGIMFPSIKDTALLCDIVQNSSERSGFEDVFIYLAAHLAELVSVTNLVAHFHLQQRKTSFRAIRLPIISVTSRILFLTCRVERCQSGSQGEVQVRQLSLLY